MSDDTRVVLEAIQSAEALADKELDDYSAQFPLPGSPTTPSNDISPIAALLVSELGDDILMAEACLAWLRRTKPVVERAKLVALYGEEWVSAAEEKLLAAESE